MTDAQPAGRITQQHRREARPRPRRSGRDIDRERGRVDDPKPRLMSGGSEPDGEVRVLAQPETIEVAARVEERRAPKRHGAGERVYRSTTEERVRSRPVL